jgi:hypothetical protein
VIFDHSLLPACVRRLIWLAPDGWDCILNSWNKKIDGDCENYTASSPRAEVWTPTVSLDAVQVMRLGIRGLETGFAQGLFHSFFRLAGALLDPADQFVFLTFLVAKVIVGQLGVLLFEFPFGDVPVTFDFEFIHNTPFGCCLLFFDFVDNSFLQNLCQPLGVSVLHGSPTIYASARVCACGRSANCRKQGVLRGHIAVSGNHLIRFLV